MSISSDIVRQMNFLVALSQLQVMFHTAFIYIKDRKPITKYAPLSRLYVRYSGFLIKWKMSSRQILRKKDHRTTMFAVKLKKQFYKRILSPSCKLSSVSYNANVKMDQTVRRHVRHRRFVRKYESLQLHKFGMQNTL